MTGNQLIALARQSALLGSRLKSFGDKDALLSEETGYSVTAVAEHLQVISKALEERAAVAMFAEIAEAAEGVSKSGRTTIIRVGIGSTSEHVNACECSNCDAERREIARQAAQTTPHLYNCPTCKITREFIERTSGVIHGVLCDCCRRSHFVILHGEGIVVSTNADDLKDVMRGDVECLS